MSVVYSHRLDWDLPPNRISQALAARRSAGGPVLDLTVSNPTAAGLDYPAARILEALAGPATLVYEPAPAGLDRAREAVTGYYAARGLKVSPERILLTASTSEAYALIFKLLGDPGDQILAPRPSYPLFEMLARLESLQVVQYPLIYDHGWSIDFPALAEAAGPRARALVIVNPNNPTGSFIKRAELDQLLDFCRRRELALVSDEVFSDYPLRPDPQRVDSLVPASGVPIFCLNGLSKACGLPQMKLGWIVVNGPREMFERLELVADTYLSAGAPAQNALPGLLEAGRAVRNEILRRVEANLAALESAIDSRSAARVLPAEGGWYAVVQVPRVRTEEEWTLELLTGDGVLVQPGYFFDFESEAYLVVSLLTHPEVFEEGILRLARHTARLGHISQP